MTINDEQYLAKMRAEHQKATDLLKTKLPLPVEDIKEASERITAELVGLDAYRIRQKELYGNILPDPFGPEGKNTLKI